MLHTHFNRLHKTWQLHFTGAQKTFSLIPIFLDSPLLKPALNCRCRKFKQKKKKNPQLSLDLWLSLELGVEPYASIRLAQKNFMKQWHLWPAQRFEFQRWSNAQRFCRLKPLLTLSMAYFQTLHFHMCSAFSVNADLTSCIHSAHISLSFTECSSSF